MASKGPSGDKRASMREGPLAALFRRTEDPAADAEAKKPESEAAAPEPQTAAGQSPVVENPISTPPAAEPAFADDAAFAEAAAAPEPEPTIPAASDEAAKDRLKRVFEMNVPSNILEPSQEDPAAPRYGRELPNPNAPVAMPGGSAVVSPSLRVVGVGGAGVNAVDRMIEAGVT
ncbi:MAG: hypothetical protein ACRDKI_11230, partial [Solirubrobacterales bacterium]